MINFLRRIYLSARDEMIRGGQLSSKNMLSLAVVGGIGHPFYWFIWTYIFPQSYENLTFRLFCGALCLSLLWHNKIPARWDFWKSLYWHIVVTTVLPCIFTFLLLMNDFDRMYMTCSVMVIFFLLIFMHSFTLVTIFLFAGSAGGYLLFKQLAPPGFELTQYDLLIENLPLFGFALIAGAIFTRALKENIELNHSQNQKLLLLKEREHVLQALAGSIAHEMRNPLGQIKYSLDTIEQTLPPLSTNEPVQTISSQTLSSLYRHVNVGEFAIKRGLQIISMILDEVKFKPIDSSNFVYLQAAQTTQKAVDEYGYETETERNKVTVKVIQDFTFRGEETLYIFVLFNIIKNALYYLKLNPSSTVVILVSPLTVSIRDTGPGIPPEQLAHIFEPFQTSGKVEGTGLGLAYCKRVMLDFGGDISCRSVFGEYTEFILHFPEVAEEGLKRHEHKIVEEAKRLFDDKYILIVDDDEILRFSAQHILENMGAHTDFAENGKVALQKLHQAHYDLVVMDINMPVLDGYATSEAIRSGSVPGHQHVPIVAYTSGSTYQAKEKMRKLNINGFVNKPCEPLVLVQAVKYALQENISKRRPPPPLAPLTGKTVLIADDGDSNRHIIASYLQAWDIDILEAAHGAAVLEQLEAHPDCDAVLMDIRMPGLSGLEATQLIRSKSSPYQTIPIIALTGSVDTELLQLDNMSGMDDFLTKPIEPTLLYEKLVSQLNKTAKPQTTLQAQSPVLTHAQVPAQPLSTTTKMVAESALEPSTEVDYTPLFNMARLNDFRGKAGLLEKCAASFQRQTTEWLNVLIASQASQNFKEMEDALHFLKGSSGTIGARALGEFVAVIYKDVTQNNRWPTQEGWLEEIISLHTQTLIGLQKYVASSSSNDALQPPITHQ